MAALYFQDYSNDELEAAVINYASKVNASEYQFLVALREFDLRKGWEAWGCLNCIDWMNFRCKISPATAREKLRTATALLALPRISAAFEQGELSYSNVRAMTRVASELNEQSLLDFALSATAHQVEQYCRQIRNGQPEASSKDANRSHRRRWLSRSNREDGSLTLSVELSPEAGDLVMAALDAAMSIQEPDSESSLFARQADALVELARSFLASDEPQSKPAQQALGEHYQVMVHVDEAALKGDGGRSDLPVQTVRRLACDSHLKVLIDDARGDPLAFGRKQRTVTAALKLALQARDKHCTYPGCTRDRWLDAHHVNHWADGGETNLANMVLLCSTHHRALHEGGYTIIKDFKGDWCFRRPDGRLLAQSRHAHRDVSRDGCAGHGFDAADAKAHPLDVSANGCTDPGIREPAAIYQLAEAR